VAGVGAHERGRDHATGQLLDHGSLAVV
jgi:hypothetical protein